jgi:hypothetical protein
VRRSLLLFALLTLTACAGGGGGDDAAAPTTPQDGEGAVGGGIVEAEDELQVQFDPGDGTPPSTWTLSCSEPVEGTHPEAAAACAHLRTLEDPFAPLPPDIVCTEQFGGPQTAQVLGSWDGKLVDLELSRVDGCRISQWDSLVPLVPAAPTGELPD